VSISPGPRGRRRDGPLVALRARRGDLATGEESHEPRRAGDQDHDGGAHVSILPRNRSTISRMTAKLIDGKAIAADIRAEVKTGATMLRGMGVVPGLATVLVGDDPASHKYVSMKRKACAEVGIESFHHELSADATQDEVLALGIDPVAEPIPLPDERLVGDLDGGAPCARVPIEREEPVCAEQTQRLVQRPAIDVERVELVSGDPTPDVLGGIVDRK